MASQQEGLESEVYISTNDPEIERQHWERVNQDLDMLFGDDPELRAQLLTPDRAVAFAASISQEEFDGHVSPNSAATRLRRLEGDKLSAPFLTIGPLISQTRRSSRAEGALTVPKDPAAFMRFANILANSGYPADELVDMARRMKGMGHFGEVVVRQVESIRSGGDRSERAAQMLDPEHTVPHSQGGKAQFPMHPVVHFYMHAKRADLAREGLGRILKAKTNGGSGITDARLDQLLSFFTAAYIVNVAGAEATRNTSTVKDSFGREAITEDIDARLGELQDIPKVEDLVSSSVGDVPEWFNAEDLVNAKAAEGKLSADKEKYTRATLSPEENVSVSKLEALARLEELTQAKAEVNAAFSGQRNSTVRAFVRSLDEKIERLRADYRVQDKVDLDEIKANAELYVALTTQSKNPFQQNLLSRICLPPMVGGLRLDWRVQLDVDPWLEIYPFAFVQGGSFVRRIADMLSNPVPYQVGEKGAFGRAEVIDPERLRTMEGINEAVYPDLRVRDVVAAHIHNEMVDGCLRSVGFEDIHSPEARRFLSPTEYDIAPASELQNVDRLAERIIGWIKAEDKIGLIGDCDQDGFLSIVVSLFVLGKISQTELETAIQTRTQGHGVRMADILNLAAKGCTKFLVHDTGSGVGDVLVFQTAHEGIANTSVVGLFEASKRSGGKAKVAMLEDFGQIMDEVDEFKGLGRRDRSGIKSAVTRFSRSLEREFAGSELTVEMLSARITAFLEREVTVRGEKVTLGSLYFVHTFFCGNQDIEFGITDHHTASIQGVQLLQSSGYVEMVNPQWVKNGEESQFIAEMEAALATNDPQKVKEVQKKFVNSRSDIVGTVVAGKVMERVLQLYGSDALGTMDHPLRTYLDGDRLSELLRVDATHLFALPDEKRAEKLREISESLAGAVEANHVVLGNLDVKFQIDLDTSWQRRGSIKDIRERVSAARAFFSADVERAIGQVMNERIIDRTAAVDVLFTAGVDGEALINGLLTSYARDHHLVVQNPGELRAKLSDYTMETLLPAESADSAIRDIESRYWEEVAKLDLPEMRFYLSYERLLPKNFYEKGSVEKQEEINQLMSRVAEPLGVLEVIGRDGERLEIDVRTCAKEVRSVGGDLYRLQSDLSDILRAFYEEHGRPNGIRGTELSTDTAIENFWKEYWGDAYKHAAFSDGEKRILECYGQNGAFDMLQVEFARAIAQVGDGGYVGREGVEGRAIVKYGQRLVEQRIEDAKVLFVPENVREALGNNEARIARWRRNRRQLLKKNEPALMDMLRAGLDGEHLDSITLLLTRILTHQMSAGINAFFRANAVKGEDTAARTKISTNLNLFVNGAKTDQERRDRARIVDAHRKAISDREKMMQKVLQKVKDERLYQKDVIVVEVSGSIIDPTAGFRGLIAGQLAGLYGKPVLVVNISGNGGKNGFHVGLSARLPGRGNLSWDIAFHSEEYSPTNPSKFRMETCGGHPEAAGGSGVVFAKNRAEVLKVIEETFAPRCANFQQTFADGGIVDYGRAAQSVQKRLQEEGFSDVDRYTPAVDPFSVLRDAAETANKILHPTGSDVPSLHVRMIVKVLAVGRSKTGDDRDYYYVQVEDESGHKGVFRSFKGEIDWKKVKTGHLYQIEIEPRLRSRPRPVAEFRPRVKFEGRTLFTQYYAGRKTNPTLDIVKILPAAMSEI